MTEISLEFIQELLKDDHPDVTIHSYEIAQGANRGDNYTSMVYRISLYGSRNHAHDGSASEKPWEGSLIYKRLPESNIRREAYMSDELFCNEVAFYTKVWPAMTNFQSLWNVKNPLKAIPKCYLARKDCVILKDLKQYGFLMPDRKRGLTVEECYVVLKHLSQFHALSLAMKFHSPDEFYELVNENNGISEVLYKDENIEGFRDYYNEAIQNAIDMVEEELKDSDTKDQYLEKFRRFCSEDTFFRTLVDTAKPIEPLAMICHGDCWTNNFLFRYADDGIAEMYFVDFQLVRYTSPAVDLVSIMYLCLDREQRQKHQVALLDYYVDQLYDRLVETREEGTGIQADELKELVLNEFKRCSPFGLGVALDMYPIMTCDSNEAPNLFESESGESSSVRVQPVWTTNTACRRKITDLVQELVDADLI